MCNPFNPKCVFGLGRGCVMIWGSGYVRMWEESVKKVRLFGLGYVRVDVWGKFIGVCEWYDGCERVLFFLNC